MIPWAIVVGINLHPDQTNLNELFGAVADAADFAEWALNPHGGGVAKDRLFFWSYPVPPDDPKERPLLTEFLKAPTPWPVPPHGRAMAIPPKDRAPYSGEILMLVNHLRKAAKLGDLAGDTHRCYVLFAGHGVQIIENGVNDTCFLTADYAMGNGFLPCNQLSRSLESGGFSEVLMFLDCCRTMAGPTIRMPNMFPVGKETTVVGVGRAAAPGEPSFEFPNPNPTRGAFTHALTDGLRTERDPEGILTFGALGAFVGKKVPTLAGRLQVPQFSHEPPSPPFVILQGQPLDVDRDLRIIFGNGIPPGTEFWLLDDKWRRVSDDPIIAGLEPVRRSAPIGRVYGLESADGRIKKLFSHDGPGETPVVLERPD